MTPCRLRERTTVRQQRRDAQFPPGRVIPVDEVAKGIEHQVLAERGRYRELALPDRHPTPKLVECEPEDRPGGAPGQARRGRTAPPPGGRRLGGLAPAGEG